MSERVGIVGSRNFTRLDVVAKYVSTLPPGTTVVSGGARGVDREAAIAAIRAGLLIDIYKANWDLHGSRAGFLRNTTIVEKSDRIVAFWDGESRGTKDTIDKARQAGKLVEIVMAVNGQIVVGM